MISILDVQQCILERGRGRGVIILPPEVYKSANKTASVAGADLSYLEKGKDAIRKPLFAFASTQLSLPLSLSSSSMPCLPSLGDREGERVATEGGDKFCDPALPPANSKDIFLNIST